MLSLFGSGTTQALGDPAESARLLKSMLVSPNSPSLHEPRNEVDGSTALHVAILRNDRSSVAVLCRDLMHPQHRHGERRVSTLGQQATAATGFDRSLGHATAAIGAARGG